MTKKLERRMKRKNLNKEKKQIEKDMKDKINMFDKLPDYCLTCEAPFDKKDKEQVFTWNVVVSKELESVRLYCPDCWQKAQDILENFKKHIESRKTGV